MIRINLLSAREAQRRVALRHQLQLLALLLVAAVAGGGWFYHVQTRELEARRAHLDQLESELKTLAKVIAEVRTFETRKGQLEKRVEVIGGLKTNQRYPARLLDEVSLHLPDQVWLVSLKEADQGLQIAGRSFDNVGIASFMENLGRSPLFAGVELVESKLEVLQGRQILAFTVRTRLTPATSSPKKDTATRS